MKKPTVQPTIERRTGPGGEDEVTERHPSYGVIRLGRYTCNPPQNFFGSAIRHNAGVSISICTATKHRNLSNDWYFAEQEIVEVNMTAAQLSELLTNMNVGDGIPCTLNHVTQTTELQAQYPETCVPACPETTKRQEFEDEFKKDMQRIADSVEALVEKAKAFVDKPHINKGDRQEFVNIAEGIRCAIANSVPFIQGQFNESLDKVLTEAKADLESFTDQLARSLGSESLRQQLTAAKPQLPALEAPK